MRNFLKQACQGTKNISCDLSTEILPCQGRSDEGPQHMLYGKENVLQKLS